MQGTGGKRTFTEAHRFYYYMMGKLEGERIRTSMVWGWCRDKTTRTEIIYPDHFKEASEWCDVVVNGVVNFKEYKGNDNGDT